MTNPIDCLKRTIVQTDAFPKRLKIEIPASFADILENESLAVELFTHSKLVSIGVLASVNRRTYAIAQLAFLHRARAFGFVVQNSAQALFKLQSAYEWFRIDFPLINSPEERICVHITQNLSGICAYLTQLHLYANPNHPALELLEAESSWKRASVKDNERPLTDELNAVAALRFAANYGRPKLVRLLLKHRACLFLDLYFEKVITLENRWVPCSLQGAVLAGDFDSVGHLLDHQTELNHSSLNLLQHALVSRELRCYSTLKCRTGRFLNQCSRCCARGMATRALYSMTNYHVS